MAKAKKPETGSTTINAKWFVEEYVKAKTKEGIVAVIQAKTGKNEEACLNIINQKITMLRKKGVKLPTMGQRGWTDTGRASLDIDALNDLITAELKVKSKK